MDYRFNKIELKFNIMSNHIPVIQFELEFCKIKLLDKSIIIEGLEIEKITLRKVQKIEEICKAINNSYGVNLIPFYL